MLEEKNKRGRPRRIRSPEPGEPTADALIDAELGVTGAGESDLPFPHLLYVGNLIKRLHKPLEMGVETRQLFHSRLADPRLNSIRGSAGPFTALYNYRAYNLELQFTLIRTKRKTGRDYQENNRNVVFNLFDHPYLKCLYRSVLDDEEYFLAGEVYSPQWGDDSAFGHLIGTIIDPYSRKDLYPLSFRRLPCVKIIRRINHALFPKTPGRSKKQKNPAQGDEQRSFVSWDWCFPRDMVNIPTNYHDCSIDQVPIENSPELNHEAEAEFEHGFTGFSDRVMAGINNHHFVPTVNFTPQFIGLGVVMVVMFDLPNSNMVDIVNMCDSLSLSPVSEIYICRNESPSEEKRFQGWGTAGLESEKNVSKTSKKSGYTAILLLHLPKIISEKIMTEIANIPTRNYRSFELMFTGSVPSLSRNIPNSDYSVTRFDPFGPFSQGWHEGKIVRVPKFKSKFRSSAAMLADINKKKRITGPEDDA